MNPTSLNTGKPTIVITGGDYCLGHELARFLLANHKHEFARVSVTLVYPERGSDLERAGAEIKQINYHDENSLVGAFRGKVDLMVLVPDPEDETRVKNTKKLVDAAQKAGEVDNILVISTAGAEAPDRKILHEFKEIEDYVKEKGQNWIVFRLAWISDLFHLWSPSITEKGVFPLTLEEHGQKFVPIELEDVAHAVRVVAHHKEHHHKQTYTLTGPHEVDSHHVVKSLNLAIGLGRVKYEKVLSKQLEEYLKSLRDRDDEHKHLKGQPTDKQIKTILDELEWIKSGAAASKTLDLKKLIHQEGKSLEEFFLKNKAEFGGRKEGNEDEKNGN